MTALDRTTKAARDRASEVRGRLPSADRVLDSVGLQRRRGSSKLALLVAAGIGGAFVYFLDPERGRGRRSEAKDRLVAAARDVSHGARRQARLVEGRTYGVRQRVLRLGRAEPADDVTLVDRVMSEAFRDLEPDLKGRLNVNAVAGVVFVRGEIPTAERIAEIETRIRAVPGVKDVEDLMHLPGTPAPSSP